MMMVDKYPGIKPHRAKRHTPKTDRKLRKDRGIAGYKSLHKNLQKMTEKELRHAIQDEFDRAGLVRPDLLSRLIGRFNRVRGQRVTQGLMGLLSYKGKRNVSKVLDSDD